jgi:hypothetical protein
MSYAHAIKIEALGRLGELLAGMEKAKGGATPGVGRRGKNAVLQRNSIPTIPDLGLTRKTAMIATQLAALPVETW